MDILTDILGARPAIRLSPAFRSADSPSRLARARRRAALFWIAALALMLLLAPAHPAAANPTKVASTKGAKKKAAAKKPHTEDVSAAFDTFCKVWMDKLVVRERDNISHIKWETKADEVHGVYVGYSQDHSCVLSASAQKVPIGTIKYKEVRYEKHGTTTAEAAQSTPQPVEVIDVTEIFSYLKGKWDF